MLAGRFGSAASSTTLVTAAQQGDANPAYAGRQEQEEHRQKSTLPAPEVRKSV